MDPETLNRFFYQNELVLRVSPETAKTKVERLRVCVRLLLACQRHETAIGVSL